MTSERLIEIAHELATANGMLRVLMATGKPHASAERDYQQLCVELRQAVDELVRHNGAFSGLP